MVDRVDSFSRTKMSYLALAAVGLAFLILFLAVLRARSNTIVHDITAIVYIYMIWGMPGMLLYVCFS